MDYLTILHALKNADSVEQRWASLSHILAEIGIDQVNYGFFDRKAAELMSAPVNFLSTMRPDWIEFYGDNRLDLSDPHVSRVRNGNLDPYLWGEDTLKSLESRVERNVTELAREAGLRSQLQVILPDSNGSLNPVAGMALGSSLSEREYRSAIKGREAMLVTIAHLFHHCSIGEVKRISDGVRPLSPRERDCLRYAAEGLRGDAVAHRLGLARVTIDMHLKRARKKLGASTLAEAVAKAIVYQEIRIG